MTLFENLQAVRQLNRGSLAFKDQYDIQTLLVGELETVSKRDNKPITDEMVIQFARKLLKSNEETLKLLNGKNSIKDSILSAALKQQNVALNSLLPQLMSEEKIRSELQFYQASEPFKNIGEVMKYMNQMYPGQFDKGLASKIAKEILS